MQFLKKYAAILVLVMVAFSACKEPEGIGLDVLPEGEEMPIDWTLIPVEAQTVRYDSVRTSGRGSYAIGDFGDPIFGNVQSQMYTQFLLNSEPGPFTTADVIDSVVLNLSYTGSYGRVDKLRGLHRFGVYEILEDMLLNEVSASDTAFYSNYSIQNISATPLGTIEFHPDLLNDVVSGQDTIGPSLRIRLDNDLGVRIKNSINLNDNDLFVDEFKGLNIRSISPTMPYDQGSLLFFDMNSSDSRLELFYHNAEDTVQYLFSINNNNALFTNVNHEFSTEVADAMTGGTAVGDDKLYVQSLAGTRIKLKFPTLRDLNDLGAVAINKAELVVPVDENSLDDFGVPAILTVSSIDSADRAFTILDQTAEFNGIDYYGGIYDETKKEYVMNVARELQSLLSNPDETDYGFYIASLVAVDGKRVVINGPNHPDPEERLRLRITYTIID
ncbi:MAG: DUF4270 domain-containing protein [Flavobacteriales bacterium]|nr:DUF4270 domain-containing protein [Flavobacteriales bacterium]MCB9190883.1 DUF4270 domain-containing protein [Flavobacteriales bacterium]MCB9205366.1 DUF4270 domain-containing protein [Flavobacteriales bacterium]